MNNSTDLKKKILESNATAHDFWADTHDSNVPYISRKPTRKYYWNLIKANIIDMGGSINNAEVLEIGCGTGTFTDLFLKNGGKNFTGIDLSTKMIEQAKYKALKNNYQNATEFFVDSLENFATHNENRFDIIQSSSFIHHLADIDEGIRCIKKMLKPDGIYIAIHEEINDFAKTKTIKLDEQLQYLLGYGGSSVISRKIRIKETIKFILHHVKQFIKTILYGNKENELKSVTVKVDETIRNESNINYVDFQLNANFSLSEKCSKYGIVKPYCYLAFPELMIFGKPLNFELLVMKK